jgi:hypothetical protein
MTTEAVTLTVDDDEDFEDAELPEVFTRCTLDVDEASAALAGAELEAVYGDITTGWLRLELVERALRVSAPHSERARRARAQVRRALAGFVEVLAGLDQATCVLRWGDPPHVAGNPNRVQGGGRAHTSEKGSAPRAGTYRNSVSL